jgi:preprotein translocase subunit YajC
MSFASFVVLLAQAQQPAAPQPGPPGGFTGGLLMPLVMIGLLFFFMVLRPQQREQRRREEQLKQLKKNDRVLTNGGMFATVVNVVPESNEVTLRVDEKNDVKIRMQLSSVARVLASDEASETKSE